MSIADKEKQLLELQRERLENGTLTSATESYRTTSTQTSSGSSIAEKEKQLNNMLSGLASDGSLRNIVYSNNYGKGFAEAEERYNGFVSRLESYLNDYGKDYGKNKSNRSMFARSLQDIDGISADIRKMLDELDDYDLYDETKSSFKDALNELLKAADSASLDARSVTAAYNNPATQRIMQGYDEAAYSDTKWNAVKESPQMSMYNALLDDMGGEEMGGSDNASEMLAQNTYDPIFWQYESNPIRQNQMLDLLAERYGSMANQMPRGSESRVEYLQRATDAQNTKAQLQAQRDAERDEKIMAEVERLKGISTDTAISSVKQTIDELDAQAQSMKKYWDEQAYLNDNSGSAPDYAEYEKLLEERAKYESILDDLYNDEDSDEMSGYTWIDDSIVRSHLSENYNAANLYDRVNKAYFDTTVDFGVEYTPNRGVKTSSYPIAQRPENYMTQEERDTFNKLWHYESEEAATAYFERLTPTLEARGAEQMMAEAKQFTEDYPNWAWVQARGANAMKPISSAFMIGDIISGEGVRENSAANMNTQVANFVDSYAPEVTNYTGNAKILGRDLDQFLYSTVGSTVDSAIRIFTASLIGGAGAGASAVENAKGIARASNALMSLEVFPSVVLEEKEKGRSDSEAVLLGALRAAIEGFTERYSVELLLSPSKNFLELLLKGAFAEGSEEIAATVLNGAVDIIAADKDNIIKEWERRTALGIDPVEALADIIFERGKSTLADGLSGALSGLMFSAGGGISGAMTPTTKSAERMAQSVEVTEALVKQALAENPNNRVALKAQEDLAAGKTISAKTVQKLIESNESVYRKDDQQTIASFVASELTNRGEVTAVNETANAIAKAVVGENLSDGDLRAIENSVFGKQLYNEVTGQTKGGEWLNQLRDNLDVVEIARPQIQRETKPTAAKRVTVKNADATTKDGTAVQIVGLEAQTDGTTKVKVRGSDGAVKVMAASELELNEISEDLIEGVAKFKGAAPAIYAAYMPTNDVGTYLNDVEYIVTAANGVAADNDGATILDYLKNSKHISDLADVQIETIFNAALAEGRKALAEAQPLSTSGSGQFTYTAKRAESSLKGREAASTVFMQALVKVAPNIDIEVFESTARMGKYIGEQGSYSDGKIRIDLNAGKNFTYDVAESAMLRTLSHELTHHLQRTAPKQYADLKAFVIKHLAEWNGGTELDDLISAKQRRSGGKLSYAAALDEVVADSCEMMLKNSAAVKQLAVENKSLFSKIRDFVKKFLSDLRRAFAGVEANDAAARYLQKFETEMQKLWDEAFTASVQNAKMTSTAIPAANTLMNPMQETEFSLRENEKFMQNAIKANEAKQLVPYRVMTAAQNARSAIAEIMRDPKLQDALNLPADLMGKTYFPDGAYNGTEENTLVCPRSMGAEELLDAVSEMIGRPLTVDECIEVSQFIAGSEFKPECEYCYVATDRKAYRAFLNSYIEQRDSVIEKYKGGMNKAALYEEFLDGRKDTKNMRDRFNLWIKVVDQNLPMMQASDLTNVNNLMHDIIEPGIKDQVKDAMKYAQSASWAKKRVGYTAYNGHILKWSQTKINQLNKGFGLRMYSFSDFSPAFILENMQMITDASVRGLKMMAYTKEADFVKIFAPTGININVSTFGFERNGVVAENAMQGVSWKEAQELRAKYPNVGITFVATNDNLVNWALEQDWIDVVIPYHLVRTGKQVAERLGFTNYTSESGDIKASNWTKGRDMSSIPPTMHNNDKQTYLNALEENHLQPRFKRWIDHPNYMKLVNETRLSSLESQPVQPKFDLESAKKSLIGMIKDGGYFQHIGGSVDRMYEIASGIAEKFDGGTQFSEEIKMSDRDESAFKAFASSINSTVNQSIIGKGYINGKIETRRIIEIGPKTAAMVSQSSQEAINLTGKYIAINSADVWHEYKRHSSETEETSRDQIAFTERQFKNAIKCIIDPDVVECIFPDTNNPTQRQSFAYAKKTNRGSYVVVEAVGGKNNPVITPVLIVQFSRAKWNRMISEGKSIGEIVHEGKEKMLSAQNADSNKKSRVFAAQFASYEAIANTPHSPQLGSTVSQRGAESQAQKSDRDHIATRDSLGNELSEQQQKFFAKSKAVDRNGKLVLLYHGTTNGGFTVFDSQFSDDKLSLFAADNLNMAFTYSGSKDVLNLPKGKPAALRWTEGSGTKGKGQVGVYQVYYNLTNPLIIDGHGENWDNLSVGEHDVVSFRVSQASGGSMYGDVPVVVEITTNGRTRTTSFSSVSEMRSELTSKYNSSVASAVASKTMRSVQSGNEVTHKIHWSNETHKEVPTMTTRDLAKKAKAEGYDGLIVRNIIDSGKYGKRTDSERGTIYVAFDSNQIKSVDNKNPTSHKDIRYSERDYEAAEIARLEQRITDLEQGKSDAFLAGQMRTARQAGKETRRLTEKIDTLKGKLEEAKQTAKDTKKATAEDRKAANLRAKNLEAQIKKLTKEAEASGFLAGEMSVARQAGAEIRNREEQIRKLKAELADRKAAYSANLAKFREGRDTGTYRERVVKRIRNLQDMLITNSDKKHIPEMLKEPLGNFLLALDTSSATKLKGKGETKGDADMYRRAVQLQKALERARNNTDEGGYLDLPDEFMDEFDLMLEQFNNLTDSGVEGIADAPINQMNSKQLQYLNFVLRTLQHSINGMNKMLATARYQTVAAAAESTIQELDQIREYQIKKGIEWLKSATAWKNATPVYAFDRMGEAGKALFKAMWDAQGDFAFSTQELLDFRNSVVDNKQVRKWSSDVQTIELSDNRTVRMTTAQMMAFYCLAQRQQALDHLKTGGMRVANIGYGKNPIQQARAYHLSVDDITKIAGMVKGEAKTVADKIQRYMTERGSEWGNEISMARFGYRAFTEPVYFPIRTESSQIAKDTKSTQENSINRLLNMSFTKSTQPNASTSVVVDNIFDVFSAHMSDMAKYNAFALPVLDMIKWYDYSVQETRADGTQKDHRAVKTSIQAAYGKEALRYISTFLEDVNGADEGGRTRSAGWAQKLTSHYKAAAVGANLRVAIQQPTSYWRAAAVLNPKYLAIGEKVMWHNTAKVKKEMEQYAGISIWKSLGFRDFNVGRSVREQIAGTLSAAELTYDATMEASMWLASAADTWTWCRLWEACKAEVKATQKLSGEALMQATADRFNDVIARTQVVDSVMTRSHTMRSKNLYDQLTTPFMAEPTLSYNVVSSALFEYSTEVRRSNKQTAWKKYGKHIGRAALVFILSSSWTAVFQSLSDATRDDDDYEEFWKKFLDAMLPGGKVEKSFKEDPLGWIEEILDQGNLLSNLNLANNIPGVHRSFLNALKGFAGDAMWQEGLKNLLNAAGAAGELVALEAGWTDKATDKTWNGNMTWWGAMQKGLQAFSQLTSLPIYNMVRDVTALYNTTVQEFFGRQDLKLLSYDPGTEGRIANAYADGFLTFEEAMAEMEKFGIAADAAYEKLVKAAGASSKYDALKEAIASGGDVKAVMEELAGYGIKEDLIEKQVKSTIKDLVLGTEEAAPTMDKQTAKNLLVEYLGLSYPEAHYAVEAYGEENFSKYDDIRDAILNGGDVQAAMDELIEYGTSESVVYKEIRESIRLWYQGETKDDGTVVDPIIDKDRAIELLVQYGDRDEEEATELVTGWSLAVETGMKDDDVKTAFLNDELSTDEAINLRMTYYGQTEEEAAQTLSEWMFEDEYGFSYDERIGQFKDGNMSADDLVDAMVEYGGKATADAEKAVAGYAKEAYADGQFTREEALSIMTSNGGYTRDEAEKKLTYVDVTAQFPDIDIDDAWIDEYYAEVESSGISMDVFVNYRNDVKGIKGEGKKANRMNVINSLPISNAQKDALYYAEGWAASTIHEAPWH